MYLRRDLYICWKRVCVSCWSLALHCFSSSAIRFPYSSSILDYELVKAACQLREHFFETRQQFVIRDKNEKKIDVYILRRYYVVCAIMCECICATARANTETWETKIMPRFWELPYVVSRRKFIVDYIRLSLDTVDMNNNL